MLFHNLLGLVLKKIGIIARDTEAQNKLVPLFYGNFEVYVLNMKFMKLELWKMDKVYTLEVAGLSPLRYMLGNIDMVFIDVANKVLENILEEIKNCSSKARLDIYIKPGE